MKYRNFDLELFDYNKIDAGESFRVRVMDSPAGQQRQAEADGVTITAALRQQVRQLAARDLHRAEIVALGKELADALLPPQVAIMFGKSMVKLERDEGVRIRLKLDTYALADLPWEYVFWDDDFLVLNRRVSLVRYEILGQPTSTLDPVSEYPLRLVAVLASPNGVPSLDLPTERQNIVKALEALPIQPEFPGDTMIALLDAFLRDAHIFHFSGHGRFNGDMGAAYGTLEGEGELLLAGDDGQVAAIAAEKIARIVADRGVRLAVLNACETGQRDQVNPWTGVVPALTRKGIPAVIGMQFRVGDKNAITFSRTFYRALALGRSIDEAMTEGRIAVDTLGVKDERDWGAPVLSLRAEESVLFPSAESFSLAGTGAGGAPLGGTIFYDTGNGGLPRSGTDPYLNSTGAGVLPLSSTDPYSHGTGAGGPILGTAGSSGSFSSAGGPGGPIQGTGGPDGPIQSGPGAGAVYWGTGDGQPIAGPTGNSKTGKPSRLPLEPDPEHVDKRNLREAMIGAFSKEELDVVCSDIQEALEDRGIQLQVSLEMVGGGSKSAQILNLIQYLDRRGYLGYLVAAVRRERPGLI